jgi:hypothetical protein
MIYVHLTADQRDELQVISRQAIGRVALRAHMVLLSDRGFAVQEIAAIPDCGEDVVRIWLHRCEREGVAGLDDEPRELSTAQGSAFLDPSSMPKPASRHPAPAMSRPVGAWPCSPLSSLSAFVCSSRVLRSGALSIRWAGAGHVPGRLRHASLIQTPPAKWPPCTRRKRWPGEGWPTCCTWMSRICTSCPFSARCG